MELRQGVRPEYITGKPSKRHPPGRVCEVPGCGTVLSTYNASTTCWTHTDTFGGRRSPLRN